MRTILLFTLGVFAISSSLLFGKFGCEVRKQSSAPQIFGSFVLTTDFAQGFSCPAGIGNGSEAIEYCHGATYGGCGGGDCTVNWFLPPEAKPNGPFKLGTTHCSSKTCQNNTPVFCGSRPWPDVPCAVIDP
jgi:hypothetical protein